VLTVGSEALRRPPPGRHWRPFGQQARFFGDEMKLRFLPISHCKNYLSAVPMDFGAANRTLSLGRMSSCIFALWIRSSSLASPGRHRRSFRQQARFVRDEMKLRFLPISHCENYLSAVPVDLGAADRILSLGRMSSCIGFFAPLLPTPRIRLRRYIHA
jgi:hypothetical protein